MNRFQRGIFDKGVYYVCEVKNKLIIFCSINFFICLEYLVTELGLTYIARTLSQKIFYCWCGSTNVRGIFYI